MSPLVRLLILLLLMHSSTVGLRFTATLDAIDHGATPLEVGAMLSCVSLFPAFFAVSVGRWLDASGPRRLLYAGFACIGFAGVLELVLPAARIGIAPLFLTCFLAGVAFLLANTIVQRLTGDLAAPSERTTAFAILSMVTAASGLVTPVITGYAIEHLGFGTFYGWVVFVAALLVVSSRTPLFSDIMSIRGTPRAKGAVKRRATDFLKVPSTRAVLVASVFISVGWEVSNLMIPVYGRSIGLSPSDIGWVLGSFAAATFVIRIFMPKLTKLLGEWNLIGWTMFVGGTALALFPFFGSLEALMACAFLLGLGLGASLPNLMSLIYRLSPRGRAGELIGMRLMMMNISKSSFPILMGALGTAVGAGSALGSLAVFLFVGFGFAAASRRDVAEGIAREEAFEAERLAREEKEAD